VHPRLEREEAYVAAAKEHLEPVDVKAALVDAHGEHRGAGVPQRFD
jgi:hypothetical protein